eukprot:SAG25_NODE_368_length_9082_cov_5.789937_6_plen_98_part_00
MCAAAAALRVSHCSKLEKSCSKLKLRSASGALPVFRFFGDSADWLKLGTTINPGDFYGLKGIINASDAFDEALFAYDGPELDGDDQNDAPAKKKEEL